MLGQLPRSSIVSNLSTAAHSWFAPKKRPRRQSTMNSFSKNLSLLVGGIFSVGLLAIGFTMLVKYKPWGVPDVLREEYDVKVAEINHRNALLTAWDGKAKPFLAVRKSQNVGLLDPLIAAEHEFEIRNDGEEPLEVEIRETSKGVTGKLAQSLLAPGESTSATLSWETREDEGDFSHSATLISNDPLQRKVVVDLRGKIKAAVVMPESIVFDATDITKKATAQFVAYSQTSENLEIVDVSCDLDECELEDLDWNVEPTTIRDGKLASKSAWLVRIWTTGMKYGRYSGDITVKVKPSDLDEEIERKVSFKGNVRSPVNFYGPEIHKSDGLDIGTMVCGETHDFHVMVRLRGDLDREIKVLDVEPKQLQAELRPLKTKGDYRLTLTVPEDCPMVVFNRPTQRGYVSVGDPHEKRFSNWLPLHGAVVKLDK